MKVTNLNETDKVQLIMEGAANAHKQVPISKNDGSPLYSFRVFTLEPNGHTPYHQHPFEHLNYIIEGKGVAVTESGEELEINKGDFVLVHPNEKHQYKNKSTSDSFIFICAVPKEYE